MKKTVSFFYFFTLFVWTTALFSASSQQPRPTTPICYLNTPRPGTHRYLPKPAPYRPAPCPAFQVADRDTLLANRAMYQLRGAIRALGQDELFWRNTITKQYIAERDLTVGELNNAIERANIQEKEEENRDRIKAIKNTSLINAHNPGKVSGTFRNRREALTQTQSILGGSRHQEPIKPTPESPLRSDIELQKIECLRDMHELLDNDIRKYIQYFDRFRTEPLKKTPEVETHKAVYKKIYQEFRQRQFTINELLKQSPDPILEKECANLGILTMQLRADCYLKTISTEDECADLHRRFIKEQPNNIGDRNRCFIIKQLIPEIDNSVNQLSPKERTHERIKAIIAEKIDGTGIHLESALKTTGYSNQIFPYRHFERNFFDDLEFPVEKNRYPINEEKMTSVLERMHRNAHENIEQLHSLFERTVEKLKQIGYDNQ